MADLLDEIYGNEKFTFQFFFFFSVDFSAAGKVHMVIGRVFNKSFKHIGRGCWNEVSLVI